jgi:hypothetical protein
VVVRGPLLSVCLCSEQHANIIATWDLDHDHKIKQNDFMMGPLYVSMLGFAPEKKHEFERLVATNGDTAAYSDLFAEWAHGKARSLDVEHMRLAERDPSGKSEEQLDLEAAADAARQRVEEDQAADDTARFAQMHGRARVRARAEAEIEAATSLANSAGAGAVAAVGNGAAAGAQAAAAAGDQAQWFSLKALQAAALLAEVRRARAFPYHDRRSRWRCSRPCDRLC